MFWEAYLRPSALLLERDWVGREEEVEDAIGEANVTISWIQ